MNTLLRRLAAVAAISVPLVAVAQTTPSGTTPSTSTTATDATQTTAPATGSSMMKKAKKAPHDSRLKTAPSNVEGTNEPKKAETPTADNPGK